MSTPHFYFFTVSVLLVFFGICYNMFPNYAVFLAGLGSLVRVSAIDCSSPSISSMLPAGASVLYTQSLPANSTFGEPLTDIAYPVPASGLPALCVVSVNVSSSATSSYTFGLFLPTETWNRRFLTIGDGGFAGGINWLDMGAGVQYGFATVSSNLGHNSTSADGTWAYGNQEAIIDWGYRALQGSIALSKQITTAFYGSEIAYSYYSGCSTGGRQGLKEVEMFPDEFDGVMAGSAAWWTAHLQPWTVKLGMYNLPNTTDYHIPVSLFPVIGAEVMRQCDGVDGLVDGIISTPDACMFRPETLLCTPTSNQSTCLTSPQIDTLYLIYNDYVDTNQTFVFPHLELGSEPQWSVLLSGSVPNPLGTDYVQDFLQLGPNWNWEDFDYSIVQLADKLDPGNATAGNFDLSPFQQRGGRLITYHGLADGLIATSSSRYFYNHVLRTLVPKGIELDSWYRFFLVPGMMHCAQSVNDAPWYFAGAGQAAVLGTSVHSTPGFMDAEHDALLALMRWVEEDIAPDMLIATKYKNDTVSEGVVRQRPLCPYPQEAKYIGTGSVNVSSNFMCA